MSKCDISEKISKEQLLKLLDIFQKNKVNYKIIFKLCKVDKLEELTVHQFNFLIYLIERE